MNATFVRNAVMNRVQDRPADVTLGGSALVIVHTAIDYAQ